MKKSVIGLLSCLYVVWLKRNPGTESHTAASVSPALLSTAQMDGAQNGMGQALRSPMPFQPRTAV